MLTNFQEAVIITLHQEPNYEFVAGEAKTAKAMMKEGLLACTGKNTYKVTSQGDKAYREHNNGKATKSQRFA